MSKYFNVNGICYPDEHYMVNIEDRLAKIQNLIDEKKYFSINRARQYGKTTTMNLLVKYLSLKYLVFLSVLRDWVNLHLRKNLLFAV